MQRALILGLMGLVLLAAVVWAGLTLAGLIAPERLRIETERRLSALLEAPVQVDQARLSLRWGLVLEATGVEVEPAGTEGLLRVERASARLDPVALWMARFFIDRLVLEGVRLSLRRGVQPPEEEDGELELRAAIEALEGVARLLAQGTLPIRDLELRGGTLLFSDESLEKPFSIRIEALTGLARRASFRRRAELRVRGRIRHGEAEGGAIELRAKADREVRATLEFEKIDLAILAPYAAMGGVASDPSGLVQGSLRWQYRPGRPQSLAVRLQGSGLGASLPLAERASRHRIALERCRLAAQIEASPASLRLQQGEISDGEVTLRAQGSLSLPVNRGAKLRLALQLDELPLPRIRELRSYLSPGVRVWLDPLSERIEAGRLLELSAEAHTTLEGFRELIETRLLGRPGEVTVRAEVADARLRIGAGERRLDELGGSAIWSADGLELRDVRGRLGERPLPRLDATIRGLSQIRSPDEVNCIPPATKASPPGFGGVWRWIRSHRRKSAEPSWSSFAVDADWIVHPALLCSLEHVRGEVFPAPDGLDFAVERGVWAGVPIAGEASYRRAPEPSLRVELRLGPPFESMQLEPKQDPWASGRWEYRANRLGQWQIRGGSGGFRLSRSTLHMEKSTLFLAPLGELEGNAEVALGSGEELPFRLELQVRKMDLVDVTRAAGREDELLSGHLFGAGVVSGRLHEGRSLLADADGVLSLHAREGKIHQQLPVFVAIAVASDRFDPFRYRDEIPYTAIDFVGRIEKGRLYSESLSLDAQSLGMVVSGQADLVKPYATEAVTGLFFLRTLDSLINRVPVLNRVILGRDENLVGAYFAITGSWPELKAKLIPIKSFAEGPAHFMFAGPSFVWNGLKRLESILNPPGIEASSEPPANAGGEDGSVDGVEEAETETREGLDGNEGTQMDTQARPGS